MNDQLYLESLKRISDRLDSIDTKLNDQAEKLSNHIAHIAGDISAMKVDLSWLKKERTVEDKGQNVNIAWLTWGLRLIIGTLVANALALIFVIYKFLK